MADLSKIAARGGAQERITNNRDAVLPTRRNTDSGNLEVNATVSQGRRSAAQAQELQRILGMTVSSAEGLQDASLARHAQQEVSNAAKGALDAAVGSKDEALAKKSRGYVKAFSVESAKAEFNKFSSDLTTEVDALLNGEQPATLDDVSELLDTRFAQLALGPDGQPFDFGDPEAQLVVARGLAELRAKVVTGATEIITEQQHQKFLGTVATNILIDSSKGKPVSFEDAMRALPPGMDRAKAKKQLVTALVEGFDEADNIKGLDDLWKSTKADGSPSFTPDEVKLIRTQRDQTEQRVEREKEKAQRDRYEANTESLLEKFAQGRSPSIAEIRRMEQADAIPAQTALTLIGHIEADAREARAESRATSAAAAASLDADIAVEVASRSLGISNGSLESDTRLLRSGRLGSGRRAIVNFQRLRSASKASANERLSTPAARTYIAEIDKALKPLAAGAKGSLLTAGTRSPANYIAAAETFQDLVGTQGKPPAEAFGVVMKQFGGGPSGRQTRLEQLRAKKEQ